MQVPTPKDVFPKKEVPAPVKTDKHPYKVKPHLTHRPFREGLAKFSSKKH